MENGNLFWALLLMALILGGLFGVIAFPRTVVEEVVVEKPVPFEVIKEVPVDREVEVEFLISPLDKAVEDFLKAAEDEEDESGRSVEVLVCDTNNYEWDEVSLRDVEDEYEVHFLDKDEYKVHFEVDLKYKQDDVSRCRQSFDVEVHYEDDEDTLVTLQNH